MGKAFQADHIRSALCFSSCLVKLGLPSEFHAADFEAPEEPPCIIAALCDLHDGLLVEAKGIKEHYFKPYISKLFDRKVLYWNINDRYVGVSKSLSQNRCHVNKFSTQWSSESRESQFSISAVTQNYCLVKLVWYEALSCGRTAVFAVKALSCWRLLQLVLIKNGEKLCQSKLIVAVISVTAVY